MSDDMNKKIQQVAELLGQDSMPDNVKELLTLLAGSLGSKQESQDNTAKAGPTDEVSEERPVLDNEIFDKVKKVMGNINNTPSDARINLLHAIKPFMNNKRQKKINNCIQLLQMSSLTRLFNDNEK